MSLIVRKILWAIILTIRDLVMFADDKLGILSIEGWMTGLLVIGTIALAIAGAFLFVNFWISLAWAIC